MLETRGPEYVQPCICVSRKRLARKRAKRLREQAADAVRDAEQSTLDGQAADADDFRARSEEYLAMARAILRDARSGHSPCITCANMGVVIGNGTYGGPAHRPRTVVSLL
jgi:hypothetical protein